MKKVIMMSVSSFLRGTFPLVLAWNLAGQAAWDVEQKAEPEYITAAVPQAGQKEVRDMPSSLRANAQAGAALEVALDPLPAADMEAVKAKPGPLAVGLSRRVADEIVRFGGATESAGLRLARAWTRMADGTTVWRLAIRSPGAAALRVHFRGFSVGDGRVWVRSAQPGGGQFVGPYAGGGLYGDGEFWSGVVFGEVAIVEYEPGAKTGPAGIVPFHIVEISHQWSDLGVGAPVGEVERERVGREPLGERGLNAREPRTGPAGGRLAEAAPCHLDASCYPEWEAPLGATALIVFQKEDGVAYSCSGTLMADLDKETSVPYFLTAGHCVNSETAARTVQSFWRYQTRSCGGQPPQISDASTVEGAIYLAGRDDGLQGDFSLLRLRENPAGSVWYSGWDSAALYRYPLDVITVHHPRGTHKRFFFGQAVAEYPFLYQDYHVFATVRAVRGRTEQGSLGAGMRTRDYLLGVLSFGDWPAEGSGKTVCDLDPAYTAYTRFSVLYPVVRPFLSLDPSETEADLTILLADTGDYFFNRGGTGEYVIRVTNSGVGKTVGAVTVRDSLPAGLTPLEARGAGWSCSMGGQDVTCTRQDPLSAGQSYPDIFLKVRAASDLPTSFRNMVRVSGGGETRTDNNTAERQGNAASDRVLTSGEPMEYSLPASTGVSRFYADQQYVISVPAGASRLEITLSQASSGVDVTMYARAGRRVTMAYTDIVANASVRVGGGESRTATLTPGSASQQLTPGPYYIALERPGSPTATTGTILATVTVSATGAPTLSQVLNAASQESGPVAPGEMVTLVGSKLGPEETAHAQDWGEALPTQVAGVQVLFDEIPAPLFMVGEELINTQVPYGVADRDRVTIRVRYDGRECEPFSVAVAEAAPGLFTLADGSGRLIAMHGSDTSGPGGMIVPENPAEPGGIMLFWATGEGQTTPAGEDGMPATPPCPHPVLPVSLYLGGLEAEILYAGSAPGMPGLFQVKARIPASSQGGDDVPVELVVGGYRSQKNVYTAIRGSGPVAPPTVTLSASPETIRAGESATLTWSSTGATSASIDHGIGAVALSGSRSVSPSTTTTYTITVRGEGGEASASATVTVTTPVEARPAEMLSPSPGSTLTGSSVTFQWSAGSGIDEYFLRVGNGVDKGDIYEGSQAKRLSVTVTGIPTDGRTIYVRLFSRAGENWQFKDYTYKAFELPNITPGVWKGKDIYFFVAADRTRLVVGGPLSRSLQMSIPTCTGWLHIGMEDTIPIINGRFDHTKSGTGWGGWSIAVSGVFDSPTHASVRAQHTDSEGCSKTTTGYEATPSQ